jgi:hypothetical protein
MTIKIRIIAQFFTGTVVSCDWRECFVSWDRRIIKYSRYGSFRSQN